MSIIRSTPNHIPPKYRREGDSSWHYQRYLLNYHNIGPLRHLQRITSIWSFCKEFFQIHTLFYEKLDKIGLNWMYCRVVKISYEISCEIEIIIPNDVSWLFETQSHFELNLEHTNIYLHTNLQQKIKNKNKCLFIYSQYSRKGISRNNVCYWIGFKIMSLCRSVDFY